MRSVVPISGSLSLFMVTFSVRPSAQPEAKATPAPTEEAVHGVKAEDRTDMGEALSIVDQAIIVNVEKLVTHEEKAALEQLPLREQIPARIAAMDKEEIAAFQQIPEENSPVRRWKWTAWNIASLCSKGPSKPKGVRGVSVTASVRKKAHGFSESSAWRI